MAYARQRLVRAPPSPPPSPSPQPLSCAPPPRVRRPLRVVPATQQVLDAPGMVPPPPPLPPRLAMRKVRPIIRSTPSAPVPVPGRNLAPSENEFYVGSPAAAPVFMAPTPKCAFLPRSLDSCDSLNAITPS